MRDVAVGLSEAQWRAALGDAYLGPARLPVRKDPNYIPRRPNSRMIIMSEGWWKLLERVTLDMGLRSRSEAIRRMLKDEATRRGL